MKIRLLRVLVSFFFLGASVVANAVTVETYIKWKQQIAKPYPYEEEANKTRLVLKAYLTGVAQGDYAAISLLEYTQKQNVIFHPYSCPPKGLTADHKLAEKMVDTYIAAHPDIDKASNVAVIYVSQMAKTYPCE